jgi:hypothetical protein
MDGTGVFYLSTRGTIAGFPVLGIDWDHSYVGVTDQGGFSDIYLGGESLQLI